MNIRHITPRSVFFLSHSLIMRQKLLTCKPWVKAWICPPQTGLHKGAHRHHLTRLGVAEDRWTAAEGRTAAVITTAATAAAQAAPPSSKRHLYLFRGTH